MSTEPTNEELLDEVVDIKVHNGSLFDYTAGMNCGVLIKQEVMQKLVRLQAEYLHNAKRLLSDGADKNQVFPSSWSLYYPRGNQTVIHYIDPKEDVRRSIEYASLSTQPRKHNLVFIAGGMDEVKAMAEARFLETGVTGDES